MKKTRILVGLTLLLALSAGMVPCARAEDRMSISYASFYCGEIEDGNFAEKIVEDKFGVEINALKLDLADTQAVNLLLASGDMPDCGWNLGDAYSNYQQGILRTIPKAMIEACAPNYAATLNNDPLGWKLAVADGGDYYALTGYVANRSTTPTYASCYRLDWLENLGIEVNGELIPLDDSGRLYMATEPFTLSEMTEILRAFTQDDPDGNGANDTYGIAPSKQDGFCWNNIQGAFGIHKTGALEDKGGEANAWYASERYRDFLAWAANAYAKGWIDKEFATIDRNQSWQKYANSQCGFACSSWEWVGASVTWANTRPPMVTLNASENGKVVVVPSEISDDGQYGSPAYQLSNYMYSFTVSADVTDEKLEKILEIFDWCCYDESNSLLLRYGIEGTHFTYDANGCPVRNENVKLGADTGLLVYSPDYVLSEAFISMTTALDQRKVREYRVSDFCKWMTYPDRVDMFNETDLSALEEKYNSTILLLADEYFFDVVTGKQELADTWAKYIENLESAGYARIREQLAKAPLYESLIGVDD